MTKRKWIKNAIIGLIFTASIGGNIYLGNTVNNQCKVLDILGKEATERIDQISSLKNEIKLKDNTATENKNKIDSLEKTIKEKETQINILNIKLTNKVNQANKANKANKTNTTNKVSSQEKALKEKITNLENTLKDKQSCIDTLESDIFTLENPSDETDKLIQQLTANLWENPSDANCELLEKLGGTK